MAHSTEVAFHRLSGLCTNLKLSTLPDAEEFLPGLSHW